jgi:anaerobic selenocysteine-containing dehydrogenase
MNRRTFLNISLLTAATAGLAGCGYTTQGPMVSQAFMPEFYLPGIAQWYATACNECSGGCGLAVRIIGGRAKKVEGIPTHPINHGAHCMKAESALQHLYNPDRLRGPMQKGQFVPDWAAAIKALAASFDQAAGSKGSGLWITGPLRGTVGALVVELARRTGSKIWVLDMPGTRTERMAMGAVTGSNALPYLNLATADYVVNFGSDFLGTEPGAVEAGWHWGQFRQGKGRARRGIMVSFASRMNLTVSNSDRWIPVRPGSEGHVVAALANALGKPVPGASAINNKVALAASGVEEDLIKRLAAKVSAAKNPLIVGGLENAMYSNGLWTLTAINALNHALNPKAATYDPEMLVAPKGVSVAAGGDVLISAKAAIGGLQQGSFKNVWVHDANPVYLLPAKLDIGKALAAANTISFSPYIDETSVVSAWTLPTTSFFESWGDVRVDGPSPAYNLQQPVVAPQPGSIPFGDILLQAAQQASSGPIKAGLSAANLHDLIGANFDPQNWTRMQAKGGLWKDFPLDWEPYKAHPMFPPPPGPNAPAATLPAAVPLYSGLKGAATAAEAKFSGNGDFTLVPYPTVTRRDGSLTNRPWQQETPDPVLQGNWDSWVEINSDIAIKLGIERGDLIEVTSENGTLKLPALPSPTVHPEMVAIPLGLGHTSYGRYAYGKGVNPMQIVTPAYQDGSDELAWASTRVSLKKVDGKGTLIMYDYRVGAPQYAERDLGPSSGTENR